MKQLDTYYRALLEYKRIAGSQEECEAFWHALKDAKSSVECVELVQTFCLVEEDWIEHIEAGIIHIANAIDEERQFILSEGEVLPIEKVKSVSSESVKHLAKHSNLISRAPVNGEIIPDAIYTVERSNDYTVYENRFLYMLLCYLRDFISVRLEKIIEASQKYENTLALEKALDLGKRCLSYQIHLRDESKNDAYLSDNNPNKEVIERINLVLRTVLSLLATPLMEDVSKTPMLKPPVTKTNILKMDKHFRGAVELYDYIMAYGKPGYTVKEEKLTTSPFSSDLASEMALLSGALTFVSYKNALGLEDALAQRYALEEERQKKEEIRHHRERIAQIKQRMQYGEIEVEEYILTLEQSFSKFETAYENTESILEKLNAAEHEIAALHLKANELDDALDVTSKHHLEEKTAMQKEHSQAVSAIQEEYAQKLNTLENTHADEIVKLHQQLENVLRENALLQSSHNKLLEENLVANARIKAALAQGEALKADYTDRESFDQLEKEYEAFKRLYRKQWKLAKKEIRKKLLNFEALKDQKGNDDA